MRTKDAQKLMDGINSAKRQLQTETNAVIRFHTSSNETRNCLFDLYGDIGNVLDNLHQEVAEMLIVDGELKAIQTFNTVQFKCQDSLKRACARSSKESQDILFTIEKVLTEVDMSDDQNKSILGLIDKLRQSISHTGTILATMSLDNSKKLSDTMMEVLNGTAAKDKCSEDASGGQT